MKDIKSFLKEITTFKTVWIDRGQGRWTTKKKMHPILRGICISSVLLIGVLTYALFPSDKSQVIAQEKQSTQKEIIIPLKELPAELPPINANLKQEVLQKVTKEIQPVNREFEIAIEKKPVKVQENKILNENKNRKTRNNTPEYDDSKYRILVSKSEYKLSLLKGNTLIKEYPIAIGKNHGDKKAIGDHRTPVGNFKIVSIEDASKWSHDFRDGKGKIKGAYGPWFLRLDAKGWKGIGIHGTHDPDSMGKSVTEGCVRLSNENIQDLRQYAYLNMPVVIREN